MSERVDPRLALEPELLEQRMAEHAARSSAPPAAGAGHEEGWRMAAVAAVLRAVPRDEARALEVLLMRRAVREGDRWSGQISLPGGHAEEQDEDLRATAVRETQEELGLDLTSEARFLGELALVRGMARGRPLELGIAPHVFLIEQEVVPEPGPEADEAFWFPLSRAATGELDGVHRYRHEGVVIPLPCWEFEERVVWGLTHRMLNGLLEVLRDPSGPDPR